MTDDLRQRQPREECPAFLAFVRRKPCCACGAPAPSQAAHVSMASRAMGKRERGFGEKASDRWTVPLCRDCHLDGPEAQHKIGEQRFWYQVGVDPCSVAAVLYAQFERRHARTPEQRENVVKRASRKQKRRFTAKSKLVSGIHLRGRLSKLTAPSRQIQNANRWPAKGSRKFGNKGSRP